MGWLLGVIALINAIAAVIAWVAKIRWSTEYRDATIRILEAKDETIKSLERHIKNIEFLNPKTLQEWYTGLKSISEEYIENLNIQLINAKKEIDSLESQGNDKNENLLQIKRAYLRLEADYQKLNEELSTKNIPNIKTLAESASSSQDLADSTFSEPLAIKLLNVDDWEIFLEDFKIVKNKEEN
jgi:hypothetical protein